MSKSKNRAACGCWCWWGWRERAAAFPAAPSARGSRPASTPRHATCASPGSSPAACTSTSSAPSAASPATQAGATRCTTGWRSELIQKSGRAGEPARPFFLGNEGQRLALARLSPPNAAGLSGWLTKANRTATAGCLGNSPFWPGQRPRCACAASSCCGNKPPAVCRG